MATHTKNKKLDLLFTKEDPATHIVMKIFQNGTVEHSDYSCQSIMLPLTIPPNNPDHDSKTNYEKLHYDKLIERIKPLKEPETL